MYHSNPLTFNNTARDLPGRKLSDTILSSSENIIFEDGIIKQRHGIQAVSNSLGSEITGISLFKKLREDEKLLLIFTNTDIYLYNTTNGKIELKTRHYNTGTVKRSSNVPERIILNGGSWIVAWNKTNLYQISFDSDKIEECASWHTVAQINSATTLTLTDSISYFSSTSYCLRLCYAGDSDNFWSSAYPYDPASNDRTIICTNGIDSVQRMNDQGYFKDFTEYPNRCKFLGFWGSVGYEHIIYANTYNTSNNINFEQTIDISDAGALTFNNGTYYELLDNNSPIQGVVPLGNNLIIYKSNSISIAQINPGGGNDNPLNIRQDIIRNVGTPSIRTVCNTGQHHIFFSGQDFYKFDGFNCNAFGTGNIKSILKEINQSYIHRSFAFILPEQNLYCLFIPTETEYCDTCIVYNYRTNSWTFWKFKDLNGAILYPMSKGKYVRTYAPTWADLLSQGILAQDMEQRYSDLILDEAFSRIIFGDKDGYLYEYNIEYLNDENNDIMSTFTTKDYDLNLPDYSFWLLEVVLSMQLYEGEPGSIDIRISVDFGRNWTEWQTVPLDGNEEYMEKKVNYNVQGKQVRAQMRATNPFIFESLRFGFNAKYKSLKFDD